MNLLSGVNALVGIWLIISPWVVGFSHTAGAAWSSVLCGVIVLVLGAIRFFTGFERVPAVTR